MAEIKFTITRTGNNLQTFQEFISALEDTVKDIGDEAQAEFEKQVSNWDHKPDFPIDFSSNKKYIRATVGPKGSGAEQWKRVSVGTRPHLIKVKKKPRLVYQTGYSPKTKPGPGGSTGGSGTFSGGFRYSKSVLHPGSAPRAFPTTVVMKKGGSWIRKVVLLANQKLG